MIYHTFLMIFDLSPTSLPSPGLFFSNRTPFAAPSLTQLLPSSSSSLSSAPNGCRPGPEWHSR